MGPGRDRLAHNRGALGRESGEEDGRFHLRADDLGRPVDAVQPAAADPHGGLAASALTGHVSAHEPERLGHAIHGPARERLVADQICLPAETRHQTDQQPHGGSRVPAVERAVGPVETCPPTAQDDRPVIVTLCDGPHRFYCGQRGRYVGSVRQPGNDRRAFRESAQEHGAMGDRLLARCANGALARGTAFDDEDAWRRHDSCSARQG